MTSAMQKIYKPNEELVNLLVSRNMNVLNKSWAAKILDYENYYCVVNGYNKIFITSTVPEDYYRDGTTFNELLALYTFDRTIREKLLTELLRVEHIVKSRIVAVFSKYHGHDHTSYLRPENFNSVSFENFKRTNSMIFDMLKLIDSKKNRHGAIKHYMDKYGYVPLWVLSKVMTFGKSNSFYACMKFEEKEEIASTFGLNPKEFKSLIDFMADIRNKCAHGERVYCYSKDLPMPRPISRLKEHSLLEIPEGKSGYMHFGKCDILASLIALRYFVAPTRYNHLLDKIDRALHKKLAKRLKSVDVSVVEKIMGLNCNWLLLKYDIGIDVQKRNKK